MRNTIEVNLGRAAYSIIEGTGDMFYIQPTSDWVDTLYKEIYNDFRNRIDELNEMYTSDPYDYCEDCWDDPDAVHHYLELLDSDNNPTLLAEAWTFSMVWNWVKVVDNNTGEIVFEAYGNEGN